MSSSEKPATARHLKDATRHNNLDPVILRQLHEKAMDPRFTTGVDGYDCILSTRTGSQDMPQLKLEMRGGKKIQILCTHAVALYEGKKAYTGSTTCHISVAFVNASSIRCGSCLGTTSLETGVTSTTISWPVLISRLVYLSLLTHLSKLLSPESSRLQRPQLQMTRRRSRSDFRMPPPMQEKSRS